MFEHDLLHIILLYAIISTVYQLSSQCLVCGDIVWESKEHVSKYT